MSNDAKPRMSIVKMVVSLGVITAVAAVILALTYDVTSVPIAEAQSNAQIDAIKAVTPEFDNNPVESADTIIVEGDTDPVVVYPAMSNGNLVGAAVETWSTTGFSGLIKVMVGLDIDGNVIDYRVLSHAETPGLGAKMDEWFRDTVGNRSVIGKSADTTPFYVSKDPNGSIDGITAATITSRAFLESLRRGSEAFKQYQSTHKDVIANE